MSQDPIGKEQVVKARINDYVEAAIGGLVTNNWHLNVARVERIEYPVSKVRIVKLEITDPTLSKTMPYAGSRAEYQFTVFISEYRDVELREEVPDDYLASDYAEELEDYLLDIRGNSSERITYGIDWIDTIKIGEESPRTVPRNIATYSVTFMVYTRWATAE